jgi:hypothetical protein
MMQHKEKQMLPLIDIQLQNQLPPLYAQDGAKRKTLYARFYLYDWEWFVMEYSPLQKLCYGLVDGDEKEYGYFRLDELEAIGVQRDMEFYPITIKGVDDERAA